MVVAHAEFLSGAIHRLTAADDGTSEFDSSRRHANNLAPPTKPSAESDAACALWADWIMRGAVLVTALLSRAAASAKVVRSPSGQCERVQSLNSPVYLLVSVEELACVLYNYGTQADVIDRPQLLIALY